METNEENISRNIKAKRVQMGLKQEEIASMLNITKPTYLNIENHPFNVSITKLLQVAECLNCTLNEFFLPIQFTKSESEEK